MPEWLGRHRPYTVEKCELPLNFAIMGSSFHRQDLKYLMGYVAPLAAAGGLWAGGWWSPGSMYVGFVLIPLFELWSKGQTTNIMPEEESSRSTNRFFDWLLYFHLPLLYSLLILYGWRMTQTPLTTFEIVGMVLNMGLIVGVSGINVGHELGHRKTLPDSMIAWLLLLPACYMHFYIEHNRGHHRWVATDKDPASARENEWLYAFWIRSIMGGYANAWHLERARLAGQGLKALHYRNSMIWFSIAQIVYLMVWYIFGGMTGLLAALGAALVGVLLLESINYIEHYALRRAFVASGGYERVQPHHSWNSNHHLGRIFLFELTRHSDHHYMATRKYQILRHFDQSPQLPMGYPGAILVALIPPLWFRVIHPLLAKRR